MAIDVIALFLYISIYLRRLCARQNCRTHIVSARTADRSHVCVLRVR